MVLCSTSKQKWQTSYSTIHLGHLNTKIPVLPEVSELQSTENCKEYLWKVSYHPDPLFVNCLPLPTAGRKTVLGIPGWANTMRQFICSFTLMKIASYGDDSDRWYQSEKPYPIGCKEYVVMEHVFCVLLLSTDTQYPSTSVLVLNFV